VSTTLSRSQLDKLGERLKSSDGPSPQDIELLRGYQAGLQETLNETIGFLRVVNTTVFTSREKQLMSVIAKLRRGSMKLSQMQDIVGFRVVVSEMDIYDDWVDHVRERSADDTVPWREYDRVHAPSHGYRAFHFVRLAPAGPIELQIRTDLQHDWAELSESLERLHPGIKLGTGPVPIQAALAALSRVIAVYEDLDQVAWSSDLEELRFKITDTLKQLRESAAAGAGAT
jgi:ppGpp synthetase/RelA/SpoT-type nucleotidyltranferase